MLICDKKGFTLVELLIVVAIIAILAAIAIPQYANYTKQAKMAACMEDVKGCLSVAASVYANTGSGTSTTIGAASCSIDSNGVGAITTTPATCTSCNLSASGKVDCTP